MTDRAVPRTEVGRRLFTDNEPMDMWESTVTPEDICYVEAAAANPIDVKRLGDLLREMYEDEIGDMDEALWQGDAEIIECAYAAGTSVTVASQALESAAFEREPASWHGRCYPKETP